MVLSEYLDVLLKRRRIIILVTVIALAASFYVGRQLPETYESTAYLRVLPYSSGSVGYEQSLYFDRLMGTLIETSGSASMQDRLEERLDADETPDYQVEQVAGTELLKISASDEDAERAQEIVGIVADLMLDQSQLSSDGGTGTSVEGLEEEVNRIKDKLDSLQEDYSDVLVDSPFEVSRINALQKEIESTQNTYNLLQENYTLARITRIIRIGSVSLAEPPLLPTEASGQSKYLTLVLGGALGLVAGVTFALVFEAFDRRVYSGENVTDLVELPIIGSVPHVGWFDRRRLSTRHFAAQSYRRIGARLAQCSEEREEAEVVLFSSAQPGEGKSTLVANLGLALVKRGYKVVVIDGDLHRPTMHKIFKIKLPQKKGLFNRLFRRRPEGGADPDKILYETDYGVDVVLLSMLAPKHKSTLNKSLMPEMVNRLKKSYELILIDSPAVMAVADALEMVKYSDDVVLVTRRTQTRQTTLRDTFEYLSQVNANWLGVVLNDDKSGSNKRWHKYYRQ